MTQQQTASIAQLKQLIEQRDLTHIKVAVVDMDGIMRGKYMSRSKFFSALENGFGFCDVVLGWDSKDQLYDNIQYTGWHSGYPDATVRLLPETQRNLPMEDNGLFLLGELTGAAEQICPRGCLRNVLSQMQQMGFAAKAGFEYEFFIFEESPLSCREKNYRDMTPLEPGFFGYSMLRNSVHADLYQGLLDLGEQMNFPIGNIISIHSLVHCGRGWICSIAVAGVSLDRHFQLQPVRRAIYVDAVVMQITVQAIQDRFPQYGTAAER